jgi:hypothetical protein
MDRLNAVLISLTTTGLGRPRRTGWTLNNLISVSVTARLHQNIACNGGPFRAGTVAG